MTQKTTQNPWLMDVRVRERNLKSGSLTDKDLEKQLAALPDVSDQAESCGTTQPALAQPPQPIQPAVVMQPHAAVISSDGADDDLDDEDDDDDDDDDADEVAVAGAESSEDVNGAITPGAAPEASIAETGTVDPDADSDSDSDSDSDADAGSSSDSDPEPGEPL